MTGLVQRLTRRQVLRAGMATAGAALAGHALPHWVLGTRLAALQQQASGDALAQFRAKMAQVPIGQTKLADGLTLLSGPGGNVAVLVGPDGKIVVDTFVQSVWDTLRGTLEAVAKTPVTSVINTHWHFDHTDNNENFHNNGATIVAHENTRKRMSEPHELLGMRFAPSPAAALPAQTFGDAQRLEANGEQIHLSYVQPAHTDTDIFIRFSKANVLHMGDVFFNGMYPFIDASTGGSIDGMIAGADAALELVDALTKIVPGHGPLADREALTKYRDMLAGTRDSVQKLKKEGRTLGEVVKAAPTKAFDATWGKGMMGPGDYVALVYNTLK
jgi:glyoxylase-like metal-dependent hydrolase (beta-lactamase superfamily II)